MADDGSQQRKPDFRAAVEDVKALATVLVMKLESVLGRKLKLRSPAVLAAIGVVATLVLALVVVMALLQAGDANAVSDNAALIGALVALGGVFTAQMVSIALDDRRSYEARDLEAQRAGEAALQNYFEQVGELYRIRLFSSALCGVAGGGEGRCSPRMEGFRRIPYY